MHVLGFAVAGTVGAGLFEPLTDYVSDPSRVPADYDFADFPAGQLEYTGYFDVETGEFGGDDLYLIPGIHSGSVLLFYRQDLLDAAGIEVPTTWAEYLAPPRRSRPTMSPASAMVGANDVSNFLVDWYSRFITMGGELTSGSKGDGTLAGPPRQPRGRRCPPEHDRPAAVLAAGGDAVRLHRGAGRVLGRQRRDVAGLGHHRRRALRSRLAGRGHRRGRADARRGRQPARHPWRLGPGHPGQPVAGSRRTVPSTS